MRLTTIILIITLALLTAIIPSRLVFGQISSNGIWPVQHKEWQVLNRFDYSSIIAIRLGPEHACTMWRLRPSIYITAAHCTENAEGKQVTDILAGAANNQQVSGRVMQVNTEDDLAAIFVAADSLFGDGLSIAREDVMVGDHVAAIGYGGGSRIPYFTFGTVSSLDVPFNESMGAPLTGTVIFGGFIPGMSGGPILNTRGDVVGVAKGTGPAHGIFHDIAVAVPLAILKRFIARLPRI